MTGLVCLQGGAEFGPGCRPMDARVLREVGSGTGPAKVVVTALASSPGREVETAQSHAVAYYTGFGHDAGAAPDARQDPDGALAELATADLVVLPGGSPTRLLDALTQTPVGPWLVEAVRSGTAVSGSSAGAMVLCAWTVLPDRAELTVVPGLGIVAGTVVVPHWSGRGGRDDWLQAIEAAVPAGTEVLGLAEQSGVLVLGDELTAVGTGPVHLLTTHREQPPGSTWRRGPQGPRTAS